MVGYNGNLCYRMIIDLHKFRDARNNSDIGIQLFGLSKLKLNIS